MPFKIHFLTGYSSDHNEISIANANIVVLYAGSLRINVAYVFSEYLTFYKWCVTKVAHCMVSSHEPENSCEVLVHQWSNIRHGILRSRFQIGISADKF